MYIRLALQPGIGTDTTGTASRGGWNDGACVRFRESYVEKILGFSRICNAPLNGRCRALHYWVDLAGSNWLAAGTNTQLYVEQAGLLYNITPNGWAGGFADGGHGQYSPLVWSLDNFGQNLIGVPSGGSVYQWVPGLPAALATKITQAPDVNNGGFVCMPEQIIMVYGSTPLGGGAADPMLARWCDQSDSTAWTPLTTNQAGSFRLSRGSSIVGGLSCALGQFLWTDLDLWQVQYIQPPLVFGFNIVGPNSGLIAKNAVVAYGDSIYWMSDHGFFRYSAGGVQPIPCTVWDSVFSNLTQAQIGKCIAGTDQNRANDVYFFYPSISGGSGEIDSYVSYNTMDNVWSLGVATPAMASQFARTAWTDQNEPGGPLSVDINGIIQQQDVGVDADGVALSCNVESGFMDIGNGEEILFVDMVIPDFDFTLSTSATPSIQMTLLFRNWPGDSTTTLGPFTVTPTTEYFTARCRAREVAIRISCNSLGSWFRMGVPRLRVAADGRI